MGLVSKNLVVRNTQVQPKIAEFISGLSTVSTTGTVTTTSLPPSTAVGDVMLAVYAQQQFGGAGPGYWSPPAGWTEILDVNSPVSGLSSRTVQAGDAGFTWTGTITSRTRHLQVSFRGAVIDVIGTAGAQVSNNATITMPSITTTANNCIVLAIVISSDAFNPPATPTGYTLRAQSISPQSDSGARPSVFIYMRDQAVAGATGAVTTNFSDFNGGHYGILISLRPV